MRKNGNGAPVFTGPGGTEYNLIGCGPLGRVGAARLSQTKFRVRVEPGVTSIDEVRRGLGPGWNQPEGTNVRFSIVVRSESEADSAIETALKAVGAHSKATLARAYELANELATMLNDLRG